MTITNTDRSVVFVGNGVTTVWPYGFIIPDAGSLVVKVTVIATGVETVISSGDFVATGLGNASGGTITYPTVGSPLPATDQITIYREVPATQPVTITNQTRYFADVVMGVWDRIVMMMQDVKETFARSLVFPVGETTSGTLPSAVDRASKFLAFDGSGNPIVAQGSLGGIAVSSFMETLLDDADAATAHVTLGTYTTNVVVTGVQTHSADIAFNDGVKALLGTGGDLQIYHDGVDAYLTSITGRLLLTVPDDEAFRVFSANGETLLSAFSNGGVILYYNNTATIQTYPNGATITGTLTADGLAGAAAGYGAPVFVLEDQKASGEDGGDATSGSWETRELQVKARDDGSVVSITSNEFTPTIDGWVEWSAPAYRVGSNQSRLYNVTDSAVVAVGKSAFCDTSSGGDASESVGGGAIVAGKTYRIEHQVGVTKSGNGHGIGSSFWTQVYTRVQGWRT